jgi:hypothetical protein
MAPFLQSRSDRRTFGGLDLLIAETRIWRNLLFAEDYWYESIKLTDNRRDSCPNIRLITLTSKILCHGSHAPVCDILVNSRFIVSRALHHADRAAQ